MRPPRPWARPPTPPRVARERNQRVSPLRVLGCGARERGGERGVAHLAVVDAFPDDVYLLGAFVEPRWVIDIGQARFAPYVSARLAALRLSVWTDVEDVSVSATGTGVQMNAAGGALVRLGDRVNLDLGATIGFANFGDIILSAAGAGSETIAGGSGQNVVLRVGLAIGPGR